MLSQEELAKWIIPQDYDHIEAEAAHLLYEADTNKVCDVYCIYYMCEKHKHCNFGLACLAIWNSFVP